MRRMEPSDAMPLDPAARGRLWREWIHTDPPQGDAPRVARRQRATSGDWLDEVIERPAGVVAGLSAAVRESLVGGELPATDRERIVARAARVGVSRFEATLLIATIQHRVRSEVGVAPSVLYRIPARRSWGVGTLLAVTLLAEAIVAGAGYLWLTR